MIISDGLIAAIITVVGTAFCTYLSIKNNRKANNNIFILNNVYLPLSKILRFADYDYGDNINSLRIFLSKLQHIIECEYQYVPNPIMESYLNLKTYVKALDFDNAFITFEFLSRQIDVEYDRLKRLNGLPNNGIRYTISTLNNKDKITLFISLVICSVALAFIAIYIINNVYNAFTLEIPMNSGERFYWQIATTLVLLCLGIICYRTSLKK